MPQRSLSDDLQPSGFVGHHEERAGGVGNIVDKAEGRIGYELGVVGELKV